MSASSNSLNVPGRHNSGSWAMDENLVSPSLRSASVRGAYKLAIISGSGNETLSEKIAQRVSFLSKSDGTGPIGLESVDISRFNDGEIQIQIKNNVRGADCFIIQPMTPRKEFGGVNSNIMELLLLIHTLRLSSAKRITAIVPYFAYARQDRKTKPRVPISASVVAQLIESMNPHRIVTVDLHCGQIQGFFHHTPVDNLYAENSILEYLEKKGFLGHPKDLTIVSPDAGGVGRATRVANKVRAKSVVTILKRRVKAGEVDSMQLVGDVVGQIAVIVDDMIDTAGTLCKAAELLRKHGASKVYAFATHGLLNGPALDRINKSCLEEVCVTDSIPQGDRISKCPKLTVLSLAPLLAEAIYRLHNETSLSALFSDKPISEAEQKAKSRKVLSSSTLAHDTERVSALSLGLGVLRSPGAAPPDLDLTEKSTSSSANAKKLQFDE